ncbi:TetR/AcrR family transcriptional regulator [Nocardioides alkalitolerans]|uniref:TetR/AcrR family transcriptional regulator n=1 Tax=Nocardioides alkalitolerans TaxID=281714 RepID=UPI00040F8893|nr:TetR/AcrR family transcriptional regulator [Nocardioides alkalitolerans]
MPRPVPVPERSGRPRDPEVDRRVLDAAVDVFARTGWAGFSIDAVARAASVGKASIYLRWSGKEALLTEAVGSAFAPISTIDSGSVRDDLLALAHLLLDLYDGPTGLAARRMVVESEATPGLADHWSEVRAAQVRATRGIVRRAVRRGELPAGTSVTLVVDTLCGAAMLRSVAVPAHLRDTAGRARSRYARELVDFVLAAATRG